MEFNYFSKFILDPRTQHIIRAWIQIYKDGAGSDHYGYTLILTVCIWLTMVTPQSRLFASLNVSESKRVAHRERLLMVRHITTNHVQPLSFENHVILQWRGALWVDHSQWAYVTCDRGFRFIVKLPIIGIELSTAPFCFHY